MNTLTKIQSELKAPKSQYNSFGNYKYRNCEDILEALKPLLEKHKAVLTITDEVKEINGIPYIEAIARFRADDSEITVTAQAGIDPNRKGMDVAQCFGASSSYARKYALNGLFLIDDTKDPDATNKGDTDKPEKPQPQSDDDKQWLNATDKNGKLNSRGEKTAAALANGTTTWQKLYETHKVSNKDKAAVEQHAKMLIEQLNNDAGNDELPF